MSLGYVAGGIIGTSSFRALAATLAAIDDLPATVSPELASTLRRYRDVIAYMAAFLGRMQRPAKRSTYDDRDVRALLRAAGVRT